VVKRLPEHVQVDNPEVLKKLAKKLERQQVGGWHNNTSSFCLLLSGRYLLKKTAHKFTLSSFLGQRSHPKSDKPSNPGVQSKSTRSYKKKQAKSIF